MGGCRCTYRNCTVRSDKQTHMFHYPVFDKIRCHQWLMNAQRLDFLNLKVSQLRNRVVCQHHFVDDYFMNYKKDKLKFDAIPTQNGPFCNASEWEDNENMLEASGAPLSYISLVDIENENLTSIEKQANYSVKYGDFLVNNEMDTKEIEFTINVKKEPETVGNVAYKLNKSNTDMPNIHNIGIVELQENNKKQQVQPILAVQPYSDQNNSSKQFELTKVDFNTMPIQVVDATVSTDLSMPNVSYEIPITFEQNKNNSIPNTKKKGKIKILSEKTISEPVPLRGILRPVSPSIIIRPKRKVESNPPKNMLDDNNEIRNMKVIFDNSQKRVCEIQQNQVDPVNHIPETIQNNNSEIRTVLDIKSNPCTLTSPIIKIKSDKPDNQSSPNKWMKSKTIPPERVAAIEEKRKFNKKLRDMIEFCLDELDDPDKTNENSQIDLRRNHSLNDMQEVLMTEAPKDSKMSGKTKQNIFVEMNSTINNDRQICKNKSLLKINKDVNVAIPKEIKTDQSSSQKLCALEARLQKMEDILLRKVEHNAQSITDLKKLLVDTHTKTTITEDDNTYKKRLYKEISVFLSPSTNSLIFEELFINKFAKNKNSVTDTPQRKKTRYR